MKDQSPALERRGNGKCPSPSQLPLRIAICTPMEVEIRALHQQSAKQLLCAVTPLLIPEQGCCRGWNYLAVFPSWGCSRPSQTSLSHRRRLRGTGSARRDVLALFGAGGSRLYGCCHRARQTLLGGSNTRVLGS